MIENTNYIVNSYPLLSLFKALYFCDVVFYLISLFTVSSGFVLVFLKFRYQNILARNCINDIILVL